jgi:hypothetical protein
MVFNAVLVVGLAIWVLRPTASAPNQAKQVIASQTSAPPLVAGLSIPTKAEVMAQPGVRYGISSPSAPWSNSELNAISHAGGKNPTMLMFFENWTKDFNKSAVLASYDRNALPVIAWEPWAGQKDGDSQPAYSLKNIINGKYDAYITKFATAVKAEKLPIAIRFAHEMNGHWYPWSEVESGNSPGQYVKMWRHVHDIFTKIGATNVIWIWSPNIFRGTGAGISLRKLYPGDAYVDWVGLVGYDVHEATAAQVYKSTMDAIEKFTKKSFILTEVGSQPGSQKVGWISNFFSWLPKHPNVAGFIWFEFSKQQGGSADWRFTQTVATTKAFKAGLAGVPTLTPPPPS